MIIGLLLHPVKARWAQAFSPSASVKNTDPNQYPRRWLAMQTKMDTKNEMTKNTHAKVQHGHASINQKVKA
jgi:hypothetical protein